MATTARWVRRIALRAPQVIHVPPQPRPLFRATLAPMLWPHLAVAPRAHRDTTVHQQSPTRFMSARQGATPQVEPTLANRVHLENFVHSHQWRSRSPALEGTTLAGARTTARPVLPALLAVPTGQVSLRASPGIIPRLDRVNA